MPKKSDKELRGFVELANRIGHREAARQCKIPYRTAWDVYERHTNGELFPDLMRPTISGGIKRLRTREETWRNAVEQNRDQLKTLVGKHKFQVKFPDKLPVAISVISDQHISVKSYVNLEQMEIDAKLIGKTPGLYAVLGGDGVDNHIKHFSAILHANSQPGVQYDLYDHYLGMFNGKIAAMCSGNHDDWTCDVAGIDMVGRLAENRRIMFAPDEVRLDISLGSVQYKMAVRHQYRFNSQLNQTHSVKQWYKNGAEEFDIGAICHHHEIAIERTILHGLARWVCRPGSYQQTTAYARRYGFNENHGYCPTFVLYPDRREIVGFHCVHHAAAFLNDARRKYARKLKKR